MTNNKFLISNKIPNNKCQISKFDIGHLGFNILLDISH